MGIAMPRRMRMMLITTIISISVKPRLRAVAGLLIGLMRPLGIRTAIGSHLIRTAVHTLDAGLIGIPRILGILLVGLPGIAAGDVVGNELDVARDEVVQCLRRFLFVQGIFLDGFIQGGQILM